MKKKLLMLSLALISCVCVAVGFSACGEETHTHDLTPYAAVDATCTEDGNIAYWYCGDCGKYFSDANGTTEISQADTVVSATGHDYDVDFSWTETDGAWTATATRSCVNNDTEPETVTAVVTEKENSRTEADCTTAGSVTYLATATFSDNTNETEEKTVTIDATEHTYSTEWTTDNAGHWHACEVCGTKIDYAAHTLGDDGKCTVCGYEPTVITDNTAALLVGANYIKLDDQDSYISGLTFAATADGTYTFTISSDCSAYVSITDIYGDSHSIGYNGTDSSIYTVSLDMDETYTYSIYVGAGDGKTFSDYTFALTISYVAKDVAVIGSADAPDEIEIDNSGNSYSLNVTLAAGESYYFNASTTNTSSFLAQLVLTDGIKLYTADGTEATLTDSTYYFSVSTTKTLLYVKNTSESSANVSISYSKAMLSLSETTNSLTVTSAMLDSEYSVLYYFTASQGKYYTVTLADGTDSNVALYYVGTSSAISSLDSYTLVLGSGSNATSYTLSGPSSRTSNAYYFAVVYTGDAAPSSFAVNITISEQTSSDVDYTALTLDTPVSLNFSSASAYYYSYTPASGTSYALCIESSMSLGTLAYMLTVTVNGTTVAGSVESDGIYYTMPSDATKYEIAISLSSSITITATLSEAEAIEYYEGTALEAGGTYTLKADTTYTFTATVAGDYTFTVGSSSSDVCIYDVIYDADDPDSTTPTIDEDIYGTGSSATTTITLAAGDTLYILCYSANYDASIITIGMVITAGETYTATFDEDITLVEATMTITEAGYYKVTLTGDSAYVTIYDNDGKYFYNRNCTLGYIIDNTASDEVAILIPAGTVLNIVIGYYGSSTAELSLLVALDADYTPASSGDDDETADYTINASTSDLTLSFSENDTYTIYVEVGGVYTFNCADYDGVIVTYTYETSYSDTGYSTYDEEVYNGATNLTLLQGDTITLLFKYTGSTSLSISYVKPVTAGEAYTVTLDSDTYYVSTTMTVTEAGYYTVSLTGDDVTNAYVSISDSTYTYYYNSSRVSIEYIIDNNASDEVAILIPAGTVLNIVIGYYGSSTAELSVLIALDANYTPASDDDTSGDTSLSLTSAGLEIVFDGTTYNYDVNFDNTYPVEITVTEAGKYEFKFTGTENLNITCGAWSAGYVDYYNGEYETDSKTFAEGDVITVYAYCAGTFTITLVSE